MAASDETAVKLFQPKHLKMEVAWVKDGQARLVHHVGDEEAYPNGYTGSELTLYFNDSDEDGPFNPGDLVQITIRNDAY